MTSTLLPWNSSGRLHGQWFPSRRSSQLCFSRTTNCGWPLSLRNSRPEVLADHPQGKQLNAADEEQRDDHRRPAGGQVGVVEFFDREADAEHDSQNGEPKPANDASRNGSTEKLVNMFSHSAMSLAIV